jgi:hypothetical protein
MSCETPFTDANVPTGMNTGVSTTPWGVVRRPNRAAPLVASISKEIDTEEDCSNRVALATWRMAVSGR